MIIAILDLGTNTFHCLIARVENDGSVKKLFKRKIAVKLGQGGINKKIITEDAAARGLRALGEFWNELKKYNPDHTEIIGTAAFREASNAADFIAEAKKITGTEIRVISGEKEAELIYMGVRKAVELGKENSLIMDIGGGSTEFIIANEEKIFWRQSFMLGAGLMLEHFIPSDPIKESEIIGIEQYLKENLLPLFHALKEYKPEALIGSSGSFDTFAEIIAHRYFTPALLKGKTTFDFDMNQFGEIYRQLLESTHATRLRTKGLIPMRADMIVIAGIFVNFIMRESGIKKMRLSTYALKEGLLWRTIERLTGK